MSEQRAAQIDKPAAWVTPQNTKKLRLARAPSQTSALTNHQSPSASVRIPEGVDFPEAAGLVIGAGTAHDGLVDRARAQAGETVLVTAASGGVGTAAVQIARSAGARVVGVASAQPRLRSRPRREEPRPPCRECNDHAKT